MNELEALKQKISRERAARLEAESLLEDKSRELYSAVEESKKLASQLQQAIGYQTRKLLNAQRVAKFGTFVWDIDESLVTWSDGIYALLAIDSANEKLSVERYFESVHPDDLESLRSLIENGVKQGLSHGDEFQTTHRIVRPNGDIRWIKGLGEFSGNGREPAKLMFGAIQDITAIKRADDAIQQAKMNLEGRLSDLEKTQKAVEIARDEAHAANMTKSRFIAMIMKNGRRSINI